MGMNILRNIESYVVSKTADVLKFAGVDPKIVNALVNFNETFIKADGSPSTTDGIAPRQKISFSALLCRPPVYTEYTDIRDYSDVIRYEQGTEYTNNYINYGKMVIISPGVMKSNFGGALWGSDKKSGTNETVNGSSKDGKINDELAKDAFNLDTSVIDLYTKRQMFGFENSVAAYWKRVEILISISARIMNLDNNITAALNRWSVGVGYTMGAFLTDTTKANSAQDASYDMIGNITGKQKRGLKLFVPFYIDGKVDGTDFSTSNATGDSMYAGMVNNDALKKVAELQFMNGVGSKAVSINGDGDTKVDIDGEGGFIKKVINSIRHGGSVATNIAMPKTYTGSTNSSPAYSFSMTATSASGNAYQIMEHVLIPLYHIIPLAMPVSVQKIGGKSLVGMSGPPPVVRVFSKGEMNIKLGLITNINIQKDKTMQTKTGLYRSIKITLTIEDLMPDIQMMEYPSYNSFFSTLGLPEMISNLCGYNIIDANPTSLIAGMKLKGVFTTDANGSNKITRLLSRDIHHGIANLGNKVRTAILPNAMGGRGAFRHSY